MNISSNDMRKPVVGDTVYFYSFSYPQANVNGDIVQNRYMQSGKVCHIFQLDGDVMPMYVIEIPTHIDPIYEVRCWHTLSLTNNEINFWKRRKNWTKAKKRERREERKSKVQSEQ